MMTHNVGLVWALALTLSVSALADWTDVDQDNFLLDSPPEAGSNEYKKDYVELHRLQENRDDDGEDCKLSRKQKWPAFATFYGKESPLTRAEAKESKDLINKVIRVAVKVCGPFKKQYERQRPYDVDEKIVPCVEKPGGSTSYPSSHAAAATASACVLAKLYPAKKAELLEWGKYLGDLRKIVGVHHPSDVVAGQRLGNDVCEVLLADEEFKEEAGL